MAEDAKSRQQHLMRQRRVAKLKKMIIATIIAGLVLPIVLCIVLFVRVASMQSEITQLKQSLQELKEQISQFQQSDETPDESADTGWENAEIPQDAVMSDAAQVLDVTGKKQVYLTFDDGPSVYTDQILDICKQYQVKATFFVVGKTGETNETILRRIVDEGHSLGMHSYSHKYNEIYASQEAFRADFLALQAYLEEVTGVKPMIARFPGGSSNSVSKIPMEQFIACYNEEQIKYFDWNVSCGDATGQPISAQEVASNVLMHIDEHNTSVVLMHDGADKRATVEALPVIIEALQARDDVVILPITEDTIPIQHIKAESVTGEN